MGDYLDTALRRAGHCLSRSNLGLADLICRTILDRTPGQPQALILLGMIAERLGLADQAASYLRQALRSDPSLDYLRVRLDALRRSSVPSTGAVTKNQRLLLIKAWGYGFWSDVGHALGAALLAELTARTPVTHWGGNSNYGDGTGGDAFRLYFEPISPLTLESVSAWPGEIFPPKWSRAELFLDEKAKLEGADARMAGIYFLQRPEAIAVTDFHIGVAELQPWIPRPHRLHGKSIDELYRHLVDKYLRPRCEIVAAVDAFHRAHVGDAPTIAVHIRGSDKRGETSGKLDEINRRYFALLDGEETERKILLLTEDTRCVDSFVERYGERLVVTESQRVSDDSNIHHAPGLDRRQLGIDVMRNTYLALRCDKFIGNGLSNVSAMIALLKKWPKHACRLVEPSILHRRNFYLHEDGSEPWLRAERPG